MKQTFVKIKLNPPERAQFEYYDSNSNVLSLQDIEESREFDAQAEVLRIKLHGVETPFLIPMRIVEKCSKRDGYIRLCTDRGVRFTQRIPKIRQNGNPLPNMNVNVSQTVQLTRKKDLNNPEDLLVKFSELEYDESLFSPIKTGTELDEFLSEEGGIPKAAQYLFAGSKGSGKTSTLIYLALEAKKKNPDCKILFLSLEMNPMNFAMTIAKYYPELKKDYIDMFFSSEYLMSNVTATEAMLKLFERGYDIILVDSLKELLLQLNYDIGLSGAGGESWIVSLMNAYNKSRHTTFFLIQQLTKKGNAAGSERIPHLVHAVMSFVKDPKSTKRYILCEKNRFSGSNPGERMYYWMDRDTGINFNYEEWKFEKDVSGVKIQSNGFRGGLLDLFERLDEEE